MEEPQQNRRQDESDARQDRIERAAADDRVSLHDVLYLVEGRMSRIESQMVALTDASNHRMEKFEMWLRQSEERFHAAMDRIETALLLKADKSAMGLALEEKADKDELVTSLGVRLLRHGYVRAAVGALMLAIITTAASQHWFIHAAQWIESQF